MIFRSIFFGGLVPTSREYSQLRPAAEAERSLYRLVPHAIFRSILRHACLQSLALALVIFYYLWHVPNINDRLWPIYRPTNRWIDLPPNWFLWAAALSFIGFAIFICFAAAANIVVMTLLNARSSQTIERLLQLCPAQSRKNYDAWFPLLREKQRKFRRQGRFHHRVWRALRITWHTFVYFRSPRGDSRKIRRIIRHSWVVSRMALGIRAWRRFAFNGHVWLRRVLRTVTPRTGGWWPRNVWHRKRSLPESVRAAGPRRQNRILAASTRQQNYAKLGALSLRREDSSLLAFSAFAVITTVAPERRDDAGLSQLHMNFHLGYFSPIAFGFFLCMLTFLIYPTAGLVLGDGSHISKFPLMAGICLWFIQGLLYLNYTLRQDFAPLFHNYFDARMFPNSMTAYANEKIDQAPNLIESIQSVLLSFFVAVVMFGLAGLYAAFLHSLG